MIYPDRASNRLKENYYEMNEIEGEIIQEI